MKTSFQKGAHSAEKTLAFGGVGALESPLLLNGVILAAIITDFTCFYSSFTSALTQDIITCFILAATCAVIIDTVPLAISNSIVQIFSPDTGSKLRKKAITILTVSTAIFLLFFAFTAVVRWYAGPSMFSGGNMASAADSMSAAPADASSAQNMTPGQTWMVILTCFLPFFTSAAVLVIGLFTNNKRQRLYKLRSEKNKLMDLRSQLFMQRSELASSLTSRLEEADSRELASMWSYLQSLCNTMQVYFCLALAEKLQGADDLTHLAHRSQQLIVLEKQLTELPASAPPQTRL